MMDSDYDAFECGDRIQCRAKPYGMNRVFPVMEMQIPLQKPDGATLTLGENRKLTYTEQQSRIYSGVTATAEERRKIQNQEVRAAIDNLTAKMTGTAGGYHLEEFDENGLWLRELYMDAPSKEKATKDSADKQGGHRRQSQRICRTVHSGNDTGRTDYRRTDHGQLCQLRKADG